MTWPTIDVICPELAYFALCIAIYNVIAITAIDVVTTLASNNEIVSRTTEHVIVAV